MIIRGSRDQCYYCKRKGKMVFVSDAMIDSVDKDKFEGSQYGPLYTCNRPDCAGGGFYDMPYAELENENANN